MPQKKVNVTSEPIPDIPREPEDGDAKVIVKGEIVVAEDTVIDAPLSEAPLLSEEEGELLATLENEVNESFRQAALALFMINQKRLYRETHKTFEEYCIERFCFSKRYTYYHIDAGEFIDTLQKSERTVHILPSSEYQVRPLSRLKEPEKKIEAWRRAVANARGKVPSFSVVSEAVSELSGREKRKPENKKKAVEIRVKDVWVIGSSHNDARLKGRVGELAIVSHVGSDNEITISLYDTEDLDVDISILSPVKTELIEEKYKLFERLREIFTSYETLPPVANILLKYFAAHHRGTLSPLEETLLSTFKDDVRAGKKDIAREVKK